MKFLYVLLFSVFILFGVGPFIAIVVDLMLWFLGADARLVQWSPIKAFFAVVWTFCPGFWLSVSGFRLLHGVYR